MYVQTNLDYQTIPLLFFHPSQSTERTLYRDPPSNPGLADHSQRYFDSKSYQALDAPDHLDGGEWPRFMRWWLDSYRLTATFSSRVAKPSSLTLVTSQKESLGSSKIS